MMIPYLWRTSRAGLLLWGSQQPGDQVCVWKHSEQFSPRPRAPCFPAAISPGTRALTLQTLEEQVPLTSRLSWPPGRQRAQWAVCLVSEPEARIRLACLGSQPTIICNISLKCSMLPQVINFTTLVGAVILSLLIACLYSTLDICCWWHDNY